MNPTFVEMLKYDIFQADVASLNIEDYIKWVQGLNPQELAFWKSEANETYKIKE